jgi:hypothetical protein
LIEKVSKSRQSKSETSTLPSAGAREFWHFDAFPSFRDYAFTPRRLFHYCRIIVPAASLPSFLLFSSGHNSPSTMIILFCLASNSLHVQALGQSDVWSKPEVKLLPDHIHGMHVMRPSARQSG